ncbi:3150_t:CDS:1, partial [Scutellospora calospora]
HTDHFKSYINSLKELNLKHRRVCHLRNRVERGTGVHSNTIEGT